MSDAAIAAAYARAIRRSRRMVTIQRVNGVSPRTGLVSAIVPCVVGGQQPDTRDVARTGYGDSEIGSISQDMRQIIVLEADLLAQRFPLPVQKNDVILLGEDADRLNVTDADADKRRLGGAIEIMASGVT